MDRFYVTCIVVGGLGVVPSVGLMFVMVTCGLGGIPIVAAGVFALFGWVLIPMRAWILPWVAPRHFPRHAGPIVDADGRAMLTLRDFWVGSLIVHAGCSFGFSKMAVAAVMGGKDVPYTETFFAPAKMAGQLLGL